MRIRIASLLVMICGLLATTQVFASTSDIEAAIMDKNYEQARELAAKFLKTSTDTRESAQAQYYLGLSQLRLGKCVDARAAFQTVMSTTSLPAGQAGSPDLYDRAALGMIEALYNPGFYTDALKEAERLLKRSPHSSFLSLIYLKIARTHLKLTHWQQAREYLQKIINDFPQSMEAPIAQNLLEEKEFFTVQVGSFLDDNKAIQLVEDLKAKGQYVYMVETTSQGKKFYRVRVGQMTSLSDAQTLEAKLVQSGYPTLIYP